MVKEKQTIHKHVLNLSYDNVSLSQHDGLKIYKGATILAPGEWTDSITRSAIVYTDKNLEANAKNWKSDFLNLDHSFATDDRIGWVKNPYADKGSVKADLYINRKLQKGIDTIERIDCGLVNGISAELTSLDKYDFKDDKYYAENIFFLGAAVCLFPACPEAKVR